MKLKTITLFSLLAVHVVFGQGVTGPNPPSYSTSAQTASYSVTAADFANCRAIKMSSTSATTVTLLASAPASGRCVLVTNTNTGIVSVSPNGLTINAQSQSWPLGQYQSILVVSDGSNYFTGSVTGSTVSYFQTPTIYNGGVPPSSATAIYIAPVQIPQTLLGITKMGIEVVAGSTGTYDVGLYYLYPGFVPGTSTLPLLCSLGGVAWGSGPVVREISTAATCNLPAGTYVFGYAGSGSATLAFGGIAIDAFPNTTATTTSGGVLPASIALPAVSAQGTVLTAPFFYLR